MEIYAKIVSFILYPFIAGITIIGNSLIILVYSRKKFQKDFYTIYIRAVCRSDMLTIVSFTISFISSVEIFQIERLSDISCKMNYFLSYSIISTSSWLIALVNLQRCAMIKYNHINLFKRPQFQYLMVVLSIVWNFGTNALFIPYFHQVVLNDSSINHPECLFNNEDISNVFYWGQFFNATLVPFITMIICSVLMIRFIYVSRTRIIDKLNRTYTKKTQKVRRLINFSVMILMLNITFLVFNMPFNVADLIYEEYDDLKYMLDVLSYCQYMFNVLIFFSFNSIFKKEFSIMVKSVKNKSSFYF